MIAARPNPARKPERLGVLAVARGPADRPIIEVGRALVVSPCCTNWSKTTVLDARTAAAAVQRYQSDRIWLSSAATVGPIGATSTQAPGGAGGAAGGSQT